MLFDSLRIESKLIPENDVGNIEYKLRLDKKDVIGCRKLVSQMVWRLNQGKEFHDYRGFAGSILSGTYKKGQNVTVLPLGIETFIDKIELHQKEVEVAEANATVVLHLKDKFDIGRGTTIVPSDNLPKTNKEFNATICWMDNTSYIPGQKIILQHNSFKTKAIISEVVSKIDIHSYAELASDGIIPLNDLCKVVIKTADFISFDSYLQNKIFGSFILINENTNNTIAAGIID